MTLKEAKEILKKEGFHMILENKVIYQNGAIREFEKPEVCEAIKVANENRLTVGLTPIEWNEREARLKKEHEENTKDPDSAENHIKEYSSENPALAESASQFNDSLLDEQGKKIKHLTKKITQLNKAIHKKNIKIEELRKESSRHLRGKIKMFVENEDLEQMLKDKNAVLADVAEELRLSKIREKNLTEVSQKYMKENEELKKKLANKIVDKIDAQALKSAESALAYKEKVIAEKDEVIADLGKELAATKNELEDKTKLVDIIRNASKEYCDYGVEANEFIKELASLYVLANNKGIINDEMLERCKNYQTYGFPANYNRETKKDINDIARGNENKKPSLFRDDSVGAVTNQKDCSSAKDTHPTEDNPEQIEKDENLEGVRNALEDGRTVFIGYNKVEECGDHSAIIAQCCKNIVISRDEAEIIERCTKNGTELHYSEKNGFTYTNMFGDEIPIICLRGMCQVFTDEEIKNMKK